jgi:hypothetical protein
MSDVAHRSPPLATFRSWTNLLMIVSESIQEEWIHEQGLGLVSRLSMRRIMARRTKAATVVG